MWSLQKLKLLNSRCQFLWHDYCSWSAYNNSHNLCKNWSCWVQDVNFCNIIVITWQTYNNLCHLCKNWSCWTQDVNFCNKIIVHDQYIIIHVIFTKIDVTEFKMSIFVRWSSQIIMWLNEMCLISNIMWIIISWSQTIILLQKLASWTQQLQSLQRWHKTIICSSCDNNYVAKIDILSSAASIFVKILWIILYANHRQ